MEQDLKKFITVKETAKMLGVTPLTLRNWDKSGKLEAGRHPFNNYRVYQRQDIEKLLVEIATNKEKRPTRPPKNRVRKLEVTHL
jgi:predicted site-specific integrase-resolvase